MLSKANPLLVDLLAVGSYQGRENHSLLRVWLLAGFPLSSGGGVGHTHMHICVCNTNWT